MSRAGLLIVFGASGVGKTAAVQALCACASWPWLRCLHFDHIEIPSEDVMRRDFGGPEAWQANATDRWVKRIAAEAQPGSVTLLEGATRPSFVRASLARYATLDAFSADVTDLQMRAVLLDCASPVRRERLICRGHAELASPQMDAWAVYLRGQTDALGIPVIDTGSVQPETVADALERELEALRSLVLGLGLA